jgi:signal transduction histidine kinase/ActR/RegA family two-component response regulator
MAGVALKCRLFACGLLLLWVTVAGVSAFLLWQDYHVSGDILRLVSAGVSPEVIRAAVARQVVYGGVIALAVLLLAVFVGFLALWHAWAPMSELAETAETMAQGDLARRASESGPAEVAAVGRALNRMADALAASAADAEARVRQCQAELAAWNHALETELLLSEKTGRDLRAAKEAAETAAEELRRLNPQFNEAVKEARRAAAAAELASHAKSEFLANMSHEIRTPLTAVLGFAETLLDPTISPSERLDAVNTIKRNGENLLAIINDLLDLSRIEAGTLEVKHEVCSIFKVVAEVQSTMHGRAHAKNLTFDVDYIGELPATIQTDAARLRQILVNLVANAVKFTDIGGVRLVVQFSESGLEPLMTFEVIDTGVGISPEALGRLFTPYVAIESVPQSLLEGTGLGMTISKRLANLLGGDLTVESTPDLGSVFRLSVATGPLDGVEMVFGQEQAIIVKRGDQALQAGDLERKRLAARLLLAEDGPDNQRLISLLLTKAGAEVDLATDGEQAKQMVERAVGEGRPYDVIIMDMEMPRMDGYTATSLLRASGYSGPILALTAYAMAGDREKCLKAGCDDYISKPVDRIKLIDTITTWLGKQSTRMPVACQTT